VKDNLVKWEKVCKPKEERNLRFRDIKLFNVALLGEWKWRLGSINHKRL